MIREIKRVIIYLVVIGFYLSTTVGFVIGFIHLILASRNPHQFGMSRLVQRVVG